MCLDVKIKTGCLKAIKFRRIIKKNNSSPVWTETLYRTNKELNALLPIKIAEEDIICYKALTEIPNAIVSPFERTEYWLNKMATADLPIAADNARYSTVYKPFNKKGLFKDRLLIIEIYHGIHAFKSSFLAECCSNLVFKAIIPKGTKYVEDNEYIVAEQMFITDEKM